MYLVVIRYFKPKPTPIRLSEEADEPLTSPIEVSLPAAEPSRTRSPSSTREHLHLHDAHFDLNVAKASVSVEVLVYTLMIFSTSGLMFASIAALGAAGMGFGPAVQSVALTLYNRRGGKDSGKLFGAMSVVQSLRCAPPSPRILYGLGTL